MLPRHLPPTSTAHGRRPLPPPRVSPPPVCRPTPTESCRPRSPHLYPLQNRSEAHFSFFSSSFPRPLTLTRSSAPLAAAAADEECRATPLPSVPAGVPPRRSTVCSTECAVSEPPEHHQATVRLCPPRRLDASDPEPHRVHTPELPTGSASLADRAAGLLDPLSAPPTPVSPSPSCTTMEGPLWYAFFPPQPQYWSTTPLDMLDRLTASPRHWPSPDFGRSRPEPPPVCLAPLLPCFL
jgi:hypothetical protein